MKVAIVAPGRPADPATVQRAQAIAAISFPEIDFVVDPQCFASDGHFAGSDALRTAAFVAAANDPTVDAIWFARGGYGSNRILAGAIPALGEAARRKSYCGYSDMGFLLGALYAAGIGRPVHAPMVIDAGRRAGGDACIARTLAWLLRRDRTALEPGLGGHPAAAFNLAILDALIGTPWLPDLADHVLLIEEVSEPLYRIDRMLFTVGNATQLKGIAGIRLGAVVDVQENDPPFAETPEQIVERWCSDLRVPYLGRARIGHTADNMVVPFGIA